MRTVDGRTVVRRVASIVVGVATAVGIVCGVGADAGAAHDLPRVEGVSVSSKKVPPGGLLLVEADGFYAVPEDYGVTFYFDLAKVELVDEKCTDVSGPQNADTPSCEYDNRFLVTTSTVGLFRVAPDASGKLRIDVCADTFAGDLGRGKCKSLTFRIA